MSKSHLNSGKKKLFESDFARAVRAGDEKTAREFLTQEPAETMLTLAANRDMALYSLDQLEFFFKMLESSKVNYLAIPSRLGDEGAKIIAKALETNDTLTTLRIYDNNIGTEGAQVLAEALKHNHTLTAMDLLSGNIEQAVKENITKLTERNESLGKDTKSVLEAADEARIHSVETIWGAPMEATERVTGGAITAPDAVVAIFAAITGAAPMIGSIPAPRGTIHDDHHHMPAIMGVADDHHHADGV